MPILVELVSSIKDGMGAKPGANEKASGLFTMASAVGAVLGPFLGGIFFEELGSQTTCDIFGFASLAMAFIFFLANMWPAFLYSKPKEVALALKQNE